MNVYNKNDPESIQKMFGSIAKSYDRTNAVLSFQMHRYWNWQLIRTTLLKSKPRTYLDLCCGTGEISINYLKKISDPSETYLLDFCPEMLAVAKERAKNLTTSHKITFLHADAQEIPLPDQSIDCITMAYGIRNIPNQKKCFNEIFRVLRKNGSLGILDLTQPQNPFLKTGHSFYLNHVVPVMGKWVTSNQEAYQYLCRSIKSFAKPEELKKMLEESGFKTPFIKNLMGGIATILVAQK